MLGPVPSEPRSRSHNLVIKTASGSGSQTQPCPFGTPQASELGRPSRSRAGCWDLGGGGLWGCEGSRRGVGGRGEGTVCVGHVTPPSLPSAPPSPFLRTRCRKPRRFGGACAFWAQPGSVAFGDASAFFFFPLIWETPGNSPAPLLVRRLDQSGKLPGKKYIRWENPETARGRGFPAAGSQSSALAPA